MRVEPGSTGLSAAGPRAASMPAWRGLLVGGLAIAAGVGAGLIPRAAGGDVWPLAIGAIGVAVVASLASLVWRADPAWLLTGALVLSPLASNWNLVGVPGALSPARLLLVAGIGTILLRAPGARWPERRLIVTPVHWVLAATVVYAGVSAAVAGTLFNGLGLFRLIDVLGVLPFLVFLVAPVAFRRERSRQVLLAGLCGLGAYLGLIALFETAGPRALVFPRFIVAATDPTENRAMGIFLDPVMNGTGLFTCGVAAAIALATWRRRWARYFAGATVVLCLTGALFTLERSVWLGTVAGAAAGALAVPRLRRLMVPLAVAGAIAVGASLLLVPGLSEHVHRRANDQATIWDRRNLATAATNMIAARPLLGFGWSTFESSSLNYFRQSPDYPIDPSLGFSATTQGTFSIHNELLDYGATLGLFGTAIWLAGIALAILGALRVRGDPSLEPWRLSLIAVAVFYFIVSSFVPPLMFPNLVLWFWIGVVWSGYYVRSDRRSVGERTAPATAG